MEKDEQWWNNMFKMYAKLVENFDNDTFLIFKGELSSIPYTYAKPREGLGIGARYVDNIANWNLYVYEVSLENQNLRMRECILTEFWITFVTPLSIMMIEPLSKLKIGCGILTQNVLLAFTKDAIKYMIFRRIITIQGCMFCYNQ